MNLHALRRVLRALIRGAHRLPLMRSILVLALVLTDTVPDRTALCPFAIRWHPRQSGCNDLYWTGRSWSFHADDALRFVSRAAAERHAIRSLDPGRWRVERMPRGP